MNPFVVQRLQCCKQTTSAMMVEVIQLNTLEILEARPSVTTIVIILDVNTRNRLTTKVSRIHSRSERLKRIFILFVDIREAVAILVSVECQKWRCHVRPHDSTDVVIGFVKPLTG